MLGKLFRKDVKPGGRTGTRGRVPGVQFASSPVLGLRLPMWRSRLVVFLLFAAFASLVGRTLWIQGPGNAFYEEEGRKRFQRTLEMPATRGKIMDRSGIVLATSLPAKAIWAVPEEVDDKLPAAQFAQLASLLGMPERDLRRKLAGEKSFIYLKRQVPNDVADKIAALKIDGVYQQREYRRFYPEGEAMAHVVGFTNIEDRGQEGMELSQEKSLAGKSGQRTVIKDRLGRVIEDIGMITPPRDGADLTLSIDSKIQYLAYNELCASIAEHKAKAGGAVVVDTLTGEILALVNWPSYNPNLRVGLSGEQLRNRVLTDTFEPGSTMKPITVAAAMELGKVTPDTIIQAGPGKMAFGSSVITDTRQNGAISVSHVIQVSSNIGAAKIGLMMEPKQLWEMYQTVGLGQVPRIGFPGAVAGRVRPYQKWRMIEQVTMSYGYGLSASLLQMARAYTMFARDGEIIPLTITRADGPVQGARVISAKTARHIREMLETVVEPGGTATKAHVEGYRVGGKTSTVHKQLGKGYASDRYRGFFVGIAPMSKPRIVVAVMIDDPCAGGHYGGDVAGPVFSAITGGTLRALNLPPDAPLIQPTRQMVSADSVAASLPEKTR
ncbi:MAG: penicillin-binding protein 2 [Candidatus Protistobacter heckmanni]|nr:penicillin-binding protein 2 [Candidatus Protistobacter heckmanni]